MIRIDIYDAQTELPKLVEASLKGEKVVICREDEPVAELKALPPVLKGPRVPGAWKGLIPQEEIDELTRPWTDEEIAELTEGPIFPGGKP